MTGRSARAIESDRGGLVPRDGVMTTEQLDLSLTTETADANARVLGTFRRDTH